MGRPINADAQATKRRILTSARSAFATQGLAGGSIRHIAQGAGVSLAMVHHYFGSKEGLYEACVQSMLDEVGELSRDLATTLSQGDQRPSVVAERAVRVGWRFARENRDAVRLLQRTIVEMGEVDADIRSGRMLPFLETMSAALATLTNRPAESLRLPLQSAIFLAVRYAISSERELVELAFGTGGGRDGAAAERAVEDHLVAATLAMLGLESVQAHPA